MTQFTDGPAAGVSLLLRRAPHFLRAVRDVKGEWDALDQLEDTPGAGETIVAYQMVGEPTWCHIRMRKGGGVYRGGQYRVIEPQPADDVLRSNARWREWANEQVQRFLAEGAAAK